jgi:hypothetical protein
MGTNKASGAGRTQALSSTLLSLGCYGVALGEALWLALLLWPYVLQNDVFLWPFFLATGLVFLASLLILASLPGLHVHWLLVVGTFLVSLLAAYGQGWLLPNAPTYGTAYWSLTYGGAVLVLSLVLLGRVKGVRPVLWRTLVVTGVGAALPVVFLILRGPADWEAPLYGLDVQLVGLVFGILTPIAGYRLNGTTRKARSSSN